MGHGGVVVSVLGSVPCGHGSGLTRGNCTSSWISPWAGLTYCVVLTPPGPTQPVTWFKGWQMSSRYVPAGKLTERSRQDESLPDPLYKYPITLTLTHHETRNYIGLPRWRHYQSYLPRLAIWRCHLLPPIWPYNIGQSPVLDKGRYAWSEGSCLMIAFLM